MVVDNHMDDWRAWDGSSQMQPLTEKAINGAYPVWFGKITTYSFTLFYNVYALIEYELLNSQHS